jgi:hypothetical protein
MSLVCGLPPPPDFNVGPALNVFCGGSSVHALENLFMNGALLRTFTAGDGKSYRVQGLTEMVYLTCETTPVMVRRLFRDRDEKSLGKDDLLLTELSALR